ncbi:PREDICTED: GDSL esterase/lipase At4g10955-like [Tarenaya hassleriana]|uniref:GDSL esterase/lipase At4g10955-like n=1 Tax=Tarenaya hassleriana TaxID=28532 RepID=UPI00053C2E25|nr:PREDICTED: GDSL esterase/lipase At4g10955-like [Tarenaya hassleriana]XP_010519421.1 PREDICTED: GDSL esterase/lipase At4g10955-like [Tarenaya hassleriana]XP_010519423.1 PREDICTED: GDSL esterase/lipase At4g10955-like [Tarenaya hassleriana]
MEEEEEEVMVKEGLMASQREIFSISGPIHLTSIDWNNAYHRTSVAACLVQGVYILERDRQQNRVGIKSQAASWWESFHFSLSETLIDDSDHSIYGAVFAYKPHYSYHHTLHGYKLPPRHVIAFRGTIMKAHSRSRDLRLDIRCVRDSLHDSTRFLHAMDVVQTTVANNGGVSAVWLAGHSLGAAVALLAGKTMTRNGFPLETYLFNPPFSSVPIERIVKNEKLKHGIRFAGSLVKAGVAMAVKGRHHKGQEDGPFEKLASWIPYLYVNSEDPICSEYVGYFEHRKKMFEIGAGKIERIATKNSLRNLLSGGGTSSSSSEPLHLLPSAYLTINTNRSPDFRRAHGIHQWWDPCFSGRYVLHQFPS